MISVCCPVLRRYDLLSEMLTSLKRSTLPVDNVYVIDNGMRGWLPDDTDLRVFVLNPPRPFGVAESWNWFIDNVKEERIITNDDITFAPHSLSQMIASPASLVWASGFSCFLLRDNCTQALGRFDETISPGYGYYEDDDYLQRLDGRGTRPRATSAENVDCGVTHHNSATLKAATHDELLEHHRRFKIAQSNYMAKWNLASL